MGCGIFSWVSNLIEKIKDIVDSVLSFINKMLPYLLIIAIVFAPYLATFLLSMNVFWISAIVGSLSTLAGVLGFWGMVAFGLVVTYLIAPDETAEMLGKVGEAVGDIAGIAGEVVGEVVGSGIGGIFNGLLGSNGLTWILVGLGAYLLLSSDSSESASNEQIKSSGKVNDTYSPPKSKNTNEIPDYNGYVVGDKIQMMR